jgi:hypothetical protein
MGKNRGLAITVHLILYAVISLMLIQYFIILSQVTGDISSQMTNENSSHACIDVNLATTFNA